MFAPPSELWVRLALTLVCSAVQGVVFLVALWFVEKPLKRLTSQTAYTVLVALLALQVVSVPIFFAVLSRDRVKEIAPLLMSPGQSDPGVVQRTGPLEADDNAVNAAPSVALLESIQGASRPDYGLPLVRFAPWVAMAYLAGVGVMLMRLLVALRGGQRLSKLSRPIEDPDLISLIVKAVRRMGFSYTPAIAICPHVAVPAVVGIVSPILLLPLAFGSGLTPAQIQQILMHELAHIRRWDPMLNLFQLLTEAILFFNPGVWYVSRKIREQRECCCDDLVVQGGGQFSYAKSLLLLSEREMDRASGSALVMSAVGPEVGGKSTLAMRVRRLIDPPSKQLHLTRKLTTFISGLTTMVMIAMVYAAATALPVQGRPAGSGFDLVDLPPGGPASENLRGGEWPALHRASAYGSREQVQMVLKTGANVNERAGRGWTALHFAVAVNRIDVAKLLLDHGADAAAANTDGRTALHTAVNIGPPLIPGIEMPNESMVHLLLGHGGKPTAADAQGLTPLHGAVMKGHLASVSAMLDAGANIEQRDVRGRAALHYACSRADDPMIEALLQRSANAQAVDNSGWSALDHLGMTLRASDPATDAAVARAAKRLLDAGVQPDFCTAASLNLLDHVRRFLDQDPQRVNVPPVKTLRGNLALHWASMRGYEQMCSLLLGYGANVHLVNDERRTALHLAIDARGGHVEIVRRLLSSGASPDAIDSRGYTPLFLATLGRNEPVVDLLLSSGADVHIRDSRGQTLLHALLNVAPKGPALPAPLPDGSILNKLLQAEANPNQADDIGVTPLHIAMDNRRKDLAEILLNHSAHVNARDNNGRTPLHRAVAQSDPDPELIMLLLSNKADPSLRDSTGRSAMDHAQTSRQSQIVALLQQRH